MPFIKVPGTDREIWVELHETKMQEGPWFTQVGTPVELSPEQFAVEMANPKSEWDFSYPHESSELGSGAEAAPLQRKTRIFSSALRKEKALRAGAGAGGRARGGKSNDTIFSAAEDIALIATHYTLSGVKRQAAIDVSTDYWIDSKRNRKPPSSRLIDAAMARIRRGGLSGIGGLIVAVRHKYRLPTLPTIRPKISRISRTK